MTEQSVPLLRPNCSSMREAVLSPSFPLLLFALFPPVTADITNGIMVVNITRNAQTTILAYHTLTPAFIVGLELSHVDLMSIKHARRVPPPTTLDNVIPSICLRSLQQREMPALALASTAARLIIHRFVNLPYTNKPSTISMSSDTH